MTYNNVLTQLMGEDRTDAITVIEDDVAFDSWMKDFERKRALQEAALRQGPGKAGKPAGKGRVKVSKEEFLERMGGGHG
jgi:hypothetical protein